MIIPAKTIVFVIVIGVVAIGVLILLLQKVICDPYNERAIARRRVVLASRPVFAIDIWYSKYYGALDVHRHAVECVCTALAECLNIHTSQILPSDRFDEELSFGGVSLLGLSEDYVMDAFWEERLPVLLGNKAQVREFDRVETIAELVQQYELCLDSNQESRQ